MRPWLSRWCWISAQQKTCTQNSSVHVWCLLQPSKRNFVFWHFRLERVQWPRDGHHYGSMPGCPRTRDAGSAGNRTISCWPWKRQWNATKDITTCVLDVFSRAWMFVWSVTIGSRTTPIHTQATGLNHRPVSRLQVCLFVLPWPWTIKYPNNCSEAVVSFPFAYIFCTLVPSPDFLVCMVPGTLAAQSENCLCLLVKGVGKMTKSRFKKSRFSVSSSDGLTIEETCVCKPSTRQVLLRRIQSGKAWLFSSEINRREASPDARISGTD